MTRTRDLHNVNVMRYQLRQPPVYKPSNYNKVLIYIRYYYLKKIISNEYCQKALTCQFINKTKLQYQIQTLWLYATPHQESGEHLLSVQHRLDADETEWRYEYL